MAYQPSKYTLGEEIAHAVTHGIGALLAIAGLAVLMVAAATRGEGAWQVVPCAIYGAAMVLMFTMSTLYHSFTNPQVKRVFRVLDHEMIFLMIAGSYTPFTTQRFEGLWAVGFTTLIWTLALAGAAVKLLAPRISDKFWSGVYVVFGWLAVAALKPMVETVHPVALALLVIGGLIYTAGVFVFISPKVRFRRAIWHGFVVTGATVHWTAVLVGVVLAPAMAHG